jgi:hypothetical protein
MEKITNDEKVGFQGKKQGDQGSMLWSQFSAKKLAFFINTNVTIKFFQNLALFGVKNAIFLLNFSAKIFLKS